MTSGLRPCTNAVFASVAPARRAQDATQWRSRVGRGIGRRPTKQSRLSNIPAQPTTDGAVGNPSLSCIGVQKENAGKNAGKNAGSHSCDTCGQPPSHPCRGGRKNRKIINLNSSVGGFVGANLFAHSRSYVRINSHLQKLHNPLKSWRTRFQQRNLGLSAVERASAKLVKQARLRYVGPRKGGRWEVLG